MPRSPAAASPPCDPSHSHGPTPARQPGGGPGIPPYRGRFAPSPTGPLHLGSLYAAVAGFLEARSRGGEWLVRIEDVDPQRCRPAHADAILRTLERYGLHWDGPVVHQSRRSAAYAAALDRLRQDGLLYACTCTRKSLQGQGRNVSGEIRYEGTCRGRSKPPAAPHALRVRAPDCLIEFHDRLQGRYGHNLSHAVGDFILKRRDGAYAYQLAVVVDDAAQGISEVLRGIDLIESTPRQIYLQQLLALPRPTYLHLPVLVDAAGRKLSKQTHARPVECKAPGPTLSWLLRALGHAPPAELCDAPPAELLAWASAAWSAAGLPAVRTLPAPPFAF